MKYHHLSFEERFVIEKLYSVDTEIRQIAEFLNRSPNTISREIKKNTVEGVYLAEKADHKAYARRWRAKSQCLKVSMDSFLIVFVKERISKPYRWSPCQISGYLRREMNVTCSSKAIYKFIESRGLEYNLFWKWNKKKGGPKKQRSGLPKDARKYIDQRPERVGVGHIELDFIVSKLSTWVFLVAVDCLTKKTWAVKLPNRKRDTIRAALSLLFHGVELKSITTDNDIAFTCWAELEALLNTPIYFTHPYHPWEKGLVENTNRWIRCFVPKKRDVGTVTGEELDEIHSFINDRPRECVGFRTASSYYLNLTCPT